MSAGITVSIFVLMGLVPVARSNEFTLRLSDQRFCLLFQMTSHIPMRDITLDSLASRGHQVTGGRLEDDRDHIVTGFVHANCTLPVAAPRDFSIKILPPRAHLRGFRFRLQAR